MNNLNTATIIEREPVCYRFIVQQSGHFHSNYLSVMKGIQLSSYFTVCSAVDK
jgi:hypothetical protein